MVFNTVMQWGSICSLKELLWFRLSFEVINFSLSSLYTCPVLGCVFPKCERWPSTWSPSTSWAGRKGIIPAEPRPGPDTGESWKGYWRPPCCAVIDKSIPSKCTLGWVWEGLSFANNLLPFYVCLYFLFLTIVLLLIQNALKRQLFLSSTVSQRGNVAFSLGWSPGLANS